MEKDSCRDLVLQIAIGVLLGMVALELQPALFRMRDILLSMMEQVGVGVAALAMYDRSTACLSPPNDDRTGAPGSHIDGMVAKAACS